MKKDKRIIFGIVAMAILIVFGVIITASLTTKINETTSTARDVVTIVDPQTGQTITFGKDGLVIITDPDGTTRTEVWDSDKIAAFMDYVNNIYGESSNYSIVFASDELIEEVSQGTGGSSGGGDDGGEDITQYFSTPTPPPGGGGSGGTGGGGNNDSDGDGIADDDVAPGWCKFWRLSYCADPVERATPTPQSSYPPGVIIAEDCDDWNSQSGYKSVISNSSCTTFSPTPSPQPI